VRGGICAPSAGDGGDLWACSTHLATPVAAQQASAIRGGLDAWLNNQAGRSNNVLAGDFNATPGSAATGAMTNYTDMISGVAVTYETNSNHIDYIWAHVPNLAGPDAMGNVPPWSYSASDHRQIWGSMHIK
jgi:endonuclease/exonuclease/phosphatase family metal-dependent hydrolase